MSLRKSREDFNTVSIGTSCYHTQLQAGQQTAKKSACKPSFKPLRKTGEELFEGNYNQDSGDVHKFILPFWINTGTFIDSSVFF